MGLSTIVSGALYFEIAEPGQSTIGNYQNLLAVVLAAAVYTVINTGSLALIVAPVMGVSPVEMWRINTAGLHVELLLSRLSAASSRYSLARTRYPSSCSLYR